MATSFIRIAFAFVVATAIAGCSEDGISSSYSVARSQAPKPTIERSHDFVANPGATGTFIYECSPGVNTCRWYQKGHNVVAGTITSGLSAPVGIGVGPSHGFVYIANAGDSNVLEYPPNSSSLAKTFNDAGEFPIDVAVDSQQNVYVANSSTTSSGPGSVTIFNQSGGLLRTLHDPRVFTGISVSVDESHDVVFCFFNNSGDAECDNFPNAKGKGNLDLTFSGPPGGNSLDIAEHNVVIVQAATAAVTFSAGAVCGFMSLLSAMNPFMMALDRSNATLYVADRGNDAVIAYPYTDCQNGPVHPSRVYNAGIGPGEAVSGVAITPGVVP
jgi:hypothetical protein